MLPGKMILLSALTIMAMTAGCGKKKSGSDDEFATQTLPAATPEATEDIFDEFYKEDSATAKQEAPVMQEPVVRSSRPPSFSENGRYAVQVSTLPSRRMADALAAKLDAQGYPSYVAEVQNPTPSLSGTYYRVRIGGFDGVSVARAFGEGTLAAEGYDYWVDYRSNDNVGLEGYGMGTGSGTDYSTSTSTSSTYDQSYTTPPPPPATVEPEPAPPPPTTTPPPASPPPAAESTAPETPPPANATPATAEQPSSTEWGNDDW